MLCYVVAVHEISEKNYNGFCLIPPRKGKGMKYVEYLGLYFNERLNLFHLVNIISNFFKRGCTTQENITDYVQSMK